MGFQKALLRVKRKNIVTGQDDKELEWLYDIVKAHRVKTMLEIGSRDGGSLYVLAHACEKGATIASLEMENGAWGRKGSMNNLLMIIAELAKEGYQSFLVEGDSGDPDTLEMVSHALTGQLDFLFIDGDHRYEAVKQDYELYESMVRPGGLIAFHDIMKDEKKKYRWGEKEVYLLWQELKQGLKTEELTTWAGIGVIRKE